MATKVIILGQDAPKEAKKPIEFKRIMNNHAEWKPAIVTPNVYQCIELISRNYADDLDLMFAYIENRNHPSMACLYLGHFNDGIVE